MQNALPTQMNVLFFLNIDVLAIFNPYGYITGGLHFVFPHSMDRGEQLKIGVAVKTRPGAALKNIFRSSLKSSIRKVVDGNLLNLPGICGYSPIFARESAF